MVNMSLFTNGKHYAAGVTSTSVINGFQIPFDDLL